MLTQVHRSFSTFFPFYLGEFLLDYKNQCLPEILQALNFPHVTTEMHKWGKQDTIWGRIGRRRG